MARSTNVPLTHVRAPLTNGEDDTSDGLSTTLSSLTGACQHTYSAHRPSSAADVSPQLLTSDIARPIVGQDHGPLAGLETGSLLLSKGLTSSATIILYHTIRHDGLQTETGCSEITDNLVVIQTSSILNVATESSHISLGLHVDDSFKSKHLKNEDEYSVTSVTRVSGFQRTPGSTSPVISTDKNNNILRHYVTQTVISSAIAEQYSQFPLHVDVLDTSSSVSSGINIIVTSAADAFNNSNRALEQNINGQDLSQGTVLKPSWNLNTYSHPESNAVKGRNTEVGDATFTITSESITIPLSCHSISGLQQTLTEIQRERVSLTSTNVPTEPDGPWIIRALTRPWAQVQNDKSPLSHKATAPQINELSLRTSPSPLSFSTEIVPILETELLYSYRLFRTDNEVLTSESVKRTTLSNASEPDKETFVGTKKRHSFHGHVGITDGDLSPSTLNIYISTKEHSLVEFKSLDFSSVTILSVENPFPRSLNASQLALLSTTIPGRVHSHRWERPTQDEQTVETEREFTDYRSNRFVKTDVTSLTEKKNSNQLLSLESASQSHYQNSAKGAFIRKTFNISAAINSTPSMFSVDETDLLSPAPTAITSDHFSRRNTGISSKDSTVAGLQLNLMESIETYSRSKVDSPLSISSCCNNNNILQISVDMSTSPTSPMALHPSSTMLPQPRTTVLPTSAPSQTRLVPAMDAPLSNPATVALDHSVVPTSSILSTSLTSEVPVVSSQLNILPSPTQLLPVSSVHLEVTSGGIISRLNTDSVTMDTTIQASLTSVSTPVNGGAGQKQASNFNTHIIIGSASAAVAVVVIIIIAIVCLKRKRRRKSQSPRNQGDEMWVELHSASPSHHMPLPSITTCHSVYDAVDTIKPEKIYKVHFPFQAQQSGQLSLEEGDVIQLIEKSDNGWWRGVTRKEGTSGWFPSAYVTQISGSKEDIKKDKLKEPTEYPEVFPQKAERQISSFQIKKESSEHTETLGQKYPVLESTGGLDHVENWVNMAASVSMTSLPVTEMSCNTNMTESNLEGHKFQAVYAYKPACKGELALKEGELVVCKERDRNGWMLGYKPRTEEEGWFPAVYVDEVPHDHELFCNSDIPETYDILESNKLHNLDQSWIGIEHSTLFEYKSAVPGDLQMEPDDLIIVLITLANGWWFGVSGTKCGWVPGSYLQMNENEPPDGLEPEHPLVPKSNSDHIGTSQNLAVGGEKQDALSVLGKTNSAQDEINNKEANNLPSALTANKTTEYYTNPGLQDVQGGQRLTIETAVSDPSLSDKKLRPTRRAPDPPGKSTQMASPSRLEVPGLELGDSFRKPARPAPLPPLRKDSNLCSLTLGIADTAQMSQPNTPGSSGPIKPVILIHGKRPKIRHLTRHQFDEKQLNPMIRPSTRGFKPRPSDDAKARILSNHEDGNRASITLSTGQTHTNSNPSITDDFHQELMMLLDQAHDKDSLAHSESKYTQQGSKRGVKGSSTVSLVSDPDIKLASPTCVLSSQAHNPSENMSYGPKQSPPSVKDTISEQSTSPLAKKPLLLSASNLIQNVQRFNHSLRTISPSPSMNSDKGSVKSTPNSTPPQSYSRKTGKSLKTLTTVPPPKVPMMPAQTTGEPHQQNSQEMNVQNGETCTNESKVFSSLSSLQTTDKIENDENNKTNEDLRSQDGRSKVTGETVPRDSLVVPPGKVSEIVQQINRSIPNKDDNIHT